MPAHPVLKLARPRHWVKNTVVLAPLLFAGLLTDPPSLHLALLAFSAFCLLASGIYVFNDLHDAPHDRHHPVKQARPIASGALSPLSAAAMGAALLAGGLALAYQLELLAPPLATHGLASIGPTAWCLTYVGLNAAYTWGLKRVPVLDVACLAAGLVLRALLGAAALQLAPSRWLVACCFCLALFLASGKRRLELSLLGDRTAATRPLVVPYGARWLDGLLMGSAGLTIACYVAYTVAADTQSKVGGAGLVVTVPFVIFGVFRYAKLVWMRAGNDPVEILTGDRLILSSALLWTATALAVVYRPW